MCLFYKAKTPKLNDLATCGLQSLNKHNACQSDQDEDGISELHIVSYTHMYWHAMLEDKLAC